MLVVGLTGSIGMGKTTVAGLLRARGLAVLDADAEVHRLYEGEAVAAIEAAFPGTTRGARVDRAKLAAALAADEEGFTRLEAIVHPRVRDAERAFLRGEAERGAWAAVLEVPLLYETGLDALLDAVVVVSATAERQRARVLERAGMSAERLEVLLGRQLADEEKRRRADFVVDTSGSHSESERQVDAILESLRGREAKAFKAHWA